MLCILTLRARKIAITFDSDCPSGAEPTSAKTGISSQGSQPSRSTIWDHITRPPSALCHDNSNRGQYWDVDEIIFDNLYLSGKKLLNGNLDVRIGRQDFLAPGDVYGEGFLLTDGTPGDGSRTFYFNAAKARLNLTPDNSIDFVYIDDPETDIFMPSFHPAISQPDPSLYVDNKKLLTTSDEQAFMIYSRNKFGKNFTFDPYYIRKEEHSFTSLGVVNPNLTLHTFGGRATFQSEGWRAKAEIARQVGHYDSNPTSMTDNKRTGLGGYMFGGYKFENTPGKPEFDLGAVYLSGDDPNNKTNEPAGILSFRETPTGMSYLYILSLMKRSRSIAARFQDTGQIWLST